MANQIITYSYVRLIILVDRQLVVTLQMEETENKEIEMTHNCGDGDDAESGDNTNRNWIQFFVYLCAYSTDQT